MTSRYLPILGVLGISVTTISFPLFFLLILTQVFKPYIDFSMYLWVKLNELLLTSHVQRSLKIRCLFRNFRFINEDAGYFPVKLD